MYLCVDNISVIQIVANHIFHKHTKHIEVEREAYDNHVIIPRINIQFQVLDILIKVVPRLCPYFVVSKLMFIDHPHQFQG